MATMVAIKRESRITLCFNRLFHQVAGKLDVINDMKHHGSLKCDIVVAIA